MQEEYELENTLVDYDVEKVTEKLIRNLWTVDFFREEFYAIHSLLQEFFADNDIQIYTEYDTDAYTVSLIFRIFFPDEQSIEQFENTLKQASTTLAVEMSEEEIEKLYKDNIEGYAFDFEYVLPETKE